MRLSDTPKSVVLVKIGKGKEAETLKIHEATAEQVEEVLAPELPEAAMVSVRIKLNGKGNKPFTHKVAGTTEGIAKKVRTVLEKASGGPAKK